MELTQPPAAQPRSDDGPRVIVTTRIRSTQADVIDRLAAERGVTRSYLLARIVDRGLAAELEAAS